MIRKVDIPARRKTKRTGGGLDPLIKILFCTLGITIHGDSDLAIIFVCHMECVFVDDWESEMLALHGAWAVASASVL